VTPAAYPRVALNDRLLYRPRERAHLRKRSQRAGPALPSYLALHHAGFSVPPMLPPERWALTPPFHPCQTERAFRRRLAGFPARCHRASLGRRYILCGTFREQGHRLKSVPPLPWRYQARCPISSPALASLRRRCPDFPPAQPFCDDQASDHPAHPPILIILDSSPRQLAPSLLEGADPEGPERPLGAKIETIQTPELPSKSR
jgi:hypothetical protein